MLKPFTNAQTLRKYSVRKKIAYLDLLRCMAAVAVVVIHVLGPYREQINNISNGAWETATTFNTLSRWAVPVFIMITGALMLSDTRKFNIGYFFKRRLRKVLVPFLAWSIFYAWLSGVSPTGYSADIFRETLVNIPHHEAYYHLGFFYYFIPLYFIVPFLRHLTQHGRPGILIGLTCIWLLLTILFLLRIDGLWSSPLLLYSGYLLFGYCLYRLQWPPVPLLILTGCISLILTDYMVISQSLAEAQYVFGRWLSYKTINTVFTAGMVFAIGRYWAGKMKPKQLEFCSFMSGHSLGIYLLHPVFLWPIRAYDLYFFHPIIMIPLWTMIVTALALGASWLLRTNRYTGWLVP